MQLIKDAAGLTGRIAGMLVGLFIVCLFATGCTQLAEIGRESREAEAEDDDPGVDSYGGEWVIQSGFTYAEVPLPDGRTVLCIVKQQSYGDAIDCDWNSLAGAR